MGNNKEQIMYKVFEIDVSWQSYEINYDLVGAKSVEDILEHWKDIYPDRYQKVHRENWMDNEDWEEMTENNKYKEGDTVSIPQFSEKQMNEINESLTGDNMWARIKEIPNMFTDTPYTILSKYSYCE